MPCCIEYIGDTMLEFDLFGIRIRVCFGFFAAVMLYFYTSGKDPLGLSAAILCCLLHEIGHLAAMFAFGCPPERLTLYAGGFRLTPSFDKLCSRTAEIVILSAGCAVNLLLAAISASVGAKDLALTNLSLAAVNLLPFSSLDGGRILALFGTRPRKTAAAATVILLTAAVFSFGLTPASAAVIAFAAAAELLL